MTHIKKGNNRCDPVYKGHDVKQTSSSYLQSQERHLHPTFLLIGNKYYRAHELHC